MYCLTRTDGFRKVIPPQKYVLHITGLILLPVLKRSLLFSASKRNTKTIWTAEHVELTKIKKLQIGPILIYCTQYHHKLQSMKPGYNITYTKKMCLCKTDVPLGTYL